MKERLFERGRCVKCATRECNERCLHYGAVVCRRTLKKVGEDFYLKGLDDLGVKYYAMAVQAEMTSGIVSSSGHGSAGARKKTYSAPRGRFETIEERYKRQQASDAIKRQYSGFRGIFGPFANKPVNRSAALSFQNHS